MHSGCGWALHRQCLGLNLYYGVLCGSSMSLLVPVHFCCYLSFPFLHISKVFTVQNATSLLFIYTGLRLPPVLWRCWLGGRKGIRPVKKQRWGAGVVVCLERGADLHMAQLMPLPLTVSCFSKIQIGFTFLVPAPLASPGKRAIKRACVCVCVCCTGLSYFY